MIINPKLIDKILLKACREETLIKFDKGVIILLF